MDEKRKKANERQKRWRAKQSEESRKKIRALDAASHHQRTLLMSPAELEAHHTAHALSQRQYIARMSPAELEAHRSSDLASQQQRIARMSPAELEAHRLANLASQQQRIARMSPEELEAHHTAHDLSQQKYISQIPRIDLAPSDTTLPFILKRRQFPIIPAYAITINKAQGQSFDHVGINLEAPVFSHGQLYVALSRSRVANQVKVNITPNFQQGKLLDDKRQFTRNVVYKEVLH